MARSPAVARWELALRLRQRRLELGIGAASLTKALGVSAAYWSHIENERNLLPKDKLEQLLDILEIDQSEQRELLALRENAKRRGWWSRYSALFGDEILRYYGLEWGAESIRTYESGMMPGLLQGEEFIRAVMLSAGATVPAIEVDQRVEARLHRQQRLTGDNRVSLRVVIGEAVLLQQVGGSGVLRRQLVHLADLVESHPENLEVRVIPFTAEDSIPAGSTYHLLDFASSRLPTLGWYETAVFGQIIIDDESRKESRVRDLGFVFERARSSALSRVESLALIREIATGLQSAG
ncbi:helix-turn-helix domain-containing protein [Nocardia sp. NBC_00881]|uniref:helix-turn-helix domain-containing protein n=1 Tax=Nocardia sp. NBC_00881 TaxID=2975995 RepID=UPI00386EDC4A|nr:helix-turn-helix domain-containing protein [Nocardia sp. NBC_00881]